MPVGTPCTEIVRDSVAEQGVSIKALVDVVKSERSQNLEKFKSIVEERPVFGKG